MRRVSPITLVKAVVAPLAVIRYLEKRRPKRRILTAVTVAITVGSFSVTLLLTSTHARTLAGPPHLSGQLWPTTRVDTGVSAIGSSESDESEQIVETEVCFTVTVQKPDKPDAIDVQKKAYQVSGTLFHDRKRKPGPRTALLLQHGATATRSTWDGDRPHVTGAPSMARPLAAAGYDVFAIDRLGYGKSPYPEPYPSGWDLTMSRYVSMTHEMVEQIQAGTFRIGSTNSCDGGDPAQRKAEKVVLMGVSNTALLIEYYATQHHDIDGIIPLMYSSQGVSDEFLKYYLPTVWGEQLAQGKDYVYLFDSQSCKDFLFYKPGVSKHVLKQVCGPKGFGGNSDQMPSGEASTSVTMGYQIKLTIGDVGPTTPALLVFARQDAIFTSGWGDSKDLIKPEMDMWEKGGPEGKGCDCNVEFLWQENAGHLGHLHDTSSELVDGILDWLDRKVR